MAWLLIGVAALAVLVTARALLRGRRDDRLRSDRGVRLAQGLLTADLAGLDVASAGLVAAATTSAELDAAVASQALPGARPVCFFDPAHGPSSTDVSWPPGATTGAVLVPACTADAARVAAGEVPGIRSVRCEDRSVPWFEAGPAYDAYAHAWFGRGPAAEAVDAARSAAARAVETNGAWDRIGWARASLGGLGEAPPAVHHRLGQLVADQHRRRP